MSRPFGGALARTRQQQQQARLVIGGAAAATAAAASPQGDDGILGRNNGGGAPQDSSTQGSGAAASASANADAAPQLALEAALPRPEAVEGEVGAMEGRIVKRMEVRLGKQRRRGYAGVRLSGLGQEAGGRNGDGAGDCLE